MPVVELDIKRLCSLIGRDIEADELVENITRLGADVEGKNDTLITVEFFPDRPDLLSVEGVARALRAYMELEPGLKAYDLAPPTSDIRVDENVLPLRGHIQCLSVRDVSLDDGLLRELMELQEDLHWALGRDRKKVAIGVHDSRDIKPPYTYKAAQPDEISFEPLGMPGPSLTMAEILEKHPKGRDYTHIINSFERYPVILDSRGNVLSMPPIINGELTKLTLESSELFVEMTGTDSRAVSKAMNILSTAFAENDWTLSQVNIIYPDKTVQTPDLSPENRAFSVEYSNKMLGLNLDQKEIKNCLEKTGYGVTEKGSHLQVQVPAYRADILHDIDIVEDVAIGYGFDRFEPELPGLATTGSRLSIERAMWQAKTAMLGHGFTEAVTLMLSNEVENNRKMGLNEKAVKVKNPISEEHTIIRTHLLPSLLSVAQLNKHRELPQRIFEVGSVLKPDENAETGAREEKKLAALIIHHKANFSEAKSIFTAIQRDLSIKGEITQIDHPSFIPGRCAGISDIGYFGELHPKVLTGFELEYPAVGMEIAL